MADQPNHHTYPAEIIERAAAILRRELGRNATEEQIDETLGKLSKAELMDKILLTHDKNISSAVLFRLVEAVFGINLDQVPVLHPEPELAVTLENADANLDTTALSPMNSANVMDKQLAALPAESRTNGPELRKAINTIFGVNLDAIAGLEQCRISLHSKGQWIVRNDRDLVYVWTGAGDIDVRVSPTGYFTEHSGLPGLPDELRSKLAGLGYTAEVSDNGVENFYYAQPDGQPVPDAFKGQTMGAIIQTLREGYMEL